MDYTEIADVIERFVNGTSAPWEWEDYFLARRYEDPYLQSIQKRVLGLSAEFPSNSKREYTSADGLAVLRELALELRARPQK